MYVCMYVCLYVCMCVCLCMYVCVCVSVYMLVYLCICLCMYLCAHFLVYVCICVCVCVCFVAQSCLTLCDPMDCSPPGSSVDGDSPGKNTVVGCHALLQGNLPSPRIEPRAPTLQADSLLSEPPGKPVCVCMYVYKILKE